MNVITVPRNATYNTTRRFHVSIEPRYAAAVQKREDSWDPVPPVCQPSGDRIVLASIESSIL
ncbi:hypothetical protein BN903_45 [Halorubrum sp. AJ67]|nr:hypothetical protein BN903_45 [Halorubrum sp. AJ67]